MRKKALGFSEPAREAEAATLNKESDPIRNQRCPVGQVLARYLNNHLCLIMAFGTTIINTARSTTSQEIQSSLAIAKDVSKGLHRNNQILDANSCSA